MDRMRSAVCVCCYGALFFLAFFLEAQELAIEEEAIQFPVTEAITLLRDEIALPDGLREEWNIVSLAHERKHAEPSEKWGEYIVQYIEESALPSPVPAYSILLIDKVPKWIQGLIRNGVKVPEDYDKSLFLFIFQDRKPIVEAYSLEERAEPLILLMSRSGTTYVLTDKKFGDEAIEEFQSRFEYHASRTLQ